MDRCLTSPANRRIFAATRHCSSVALNIRS
jgi:hypothetical protein